jgi:penicillin-binding protein 1A
MAGIRRWLRRLSILALLGLGLGLVAAGVVYWRIAPTLPDVRELRTVSLQTPLQVYSADGKLIAVIGETRRIPVRIEQVPLRVRQAVIAIEDARFYQHHGVDWKGVGRAVWLLATTDNERVPGGSTITQQVARNFYLTTEYKYSRKLKEMLLAIKMERELSKDEILALYLNRIFFGNRAYGIAAAADYYYGKPLDQLTLAEAAMLAGVPKFPSSANPLANPARARFRRDYILQRMRELGFISAAEERQAQAEPDRASPHEPKIELQAPYLAEMVRQAMQERYGEESETSGLRVYATVHSRDQLAAEQAVLDGLIEYDRRHGWRGPEAQLVLADGEDARALRKRLAAHAFVPGLPAAIVTGIEGDRVRLFLRSGDSVTLDGAATRWTNKTPAALLKRGDVVRLRALRTEASPAGRTAAPVALTAAPVRYELAQLPKAEAALVSLQPEDGALRALVGGLSFWRSSFNRALQATRQPGSSFKPFVYAAAFERGYTPASIVLDAPVVFKDRKGHVWRPQNDNATFAGPMRLREAMVQSRNLVSVRLLDAVGVDFTREYISRFGFAKASLPPNLSMSLGTASLTPMSVARGYSVFANGGFLIEPYFIARVVDRHGKQLAIAQPLHACRSCAQRLDSEERTATIIDGFDFSSEGPRNKPGKPAASSGQTAATPALNLAPRAIDERTAFLTSSLMKDVVLRGTAIAAKVLERADIGGKTGSTNNHRDAWFSGFGGDLVTTVWVGRDNFESLGYREYGGKAALPIWINYMRTALKDVPVLESLPPAGIVKVSIAPGSGHILPEGTPGALTDYMKQEDYDRTLSSGYGNYDAAPDEESFDIF